MTIQSEALPQLSRDEINRYYLSLLNDPELNSQIFGSLSNVQHYLDDHRVAFLNEIKPIIDQHTDDSRSILLHLIERHAYEDEITDVLETQKLLPGFSYADTALVLHSLKFYRYNDLIPSIAAVRKNPQQLIALHRVVHTIRSIRPVDETNVPKSHPLEFDNWFIGKRLAFHIKNKELLELTLNYADQIDLITRIIREQGGHSIAALQSMLEGGSAPLSVGAL